MHEILSLAAFLVLGLFVTAHAQEGPETVTSGPSATWSCTVDTGMNVCTCEGVENCAAMSADADCTGATSKACDPDGCTCAGPAREMSLDPRPQHNPNSGLVMPDDAPTGTEPSPVPPIATPIPHAQVGWVSDGSAENEIIPSRRGTPSQGTNLSEDIVAPNNIIAPNNAVPPRESSQRDHRRLSAPNPNDGTSNTLLFDEADALFGATSDSPDEDHNEIIAPNNRSNDHQTDAVRMRRAASAAANEESRRNEVVPARRGTMAAPSDVTLSNVTRTTLTLEWHDNTRWEFGVEVERGTPTRERGGINYHWRRVFNVEERVESHTQGTGLRSDGDDGLTPATRYCYRLRAYREGNYSGYSNATCTQTLP
jgi:hypothetical protein